MKQNSVLKLLRFIFDGCVLLGQTIDILFK